MYLSEDVDGMTKMIHAKLLEDNNYKETMLLMGLNDEASQESFTDSMSMAMHRVLRYLVTAECDCNHCRFMRYVLRECLKDCNRSDSIAHKKGAAHDKDHPSCTGLEFDAKRKPCWDYKKGFVH